MLLYEKQPKHNSKTLIAAELTKHIHKERSVTLCTQKNFVPKLFLQLATTKH